MRSEPEQPLVSVITPCLNRVRFVRDAIESLLIQDYPRIEHIVMDGGSTDGTLDVLRHYEGRIRWYSESDTGQSDALNKLLRLVEGEIVGWLNSDDFYYEGAIRRVVEAFSSKPDADVIYGRCAIVEERGAFVRMHSTRPFSLPRLVSYDAGYIPVQSTFFRRRVIDAVGDFDTSLRYALDYDWLVRAGLSCNVHHVPAVLGAFRQHRDATQGPELRRDYVREVVKVSRRYGGNAFTPLRTQAFERVPGLPRAAVALLPLKRLLVRAGLVPDWL